MSGRCSSGTCAAAAAAAAAARTVKRGECVASQARTSACEREVWPSGWRSTGARPNCADTCAGGSAWMPPLKKYSTP